MTKTKTSSATPLRTITLSIADLDHVRGGLLAAADPDREEDDETGRERIYRDTGGYIARP